jgi:hypothetical protein
MYPALLMLMRTTRFPLGMEWEDSTIHTTSEHGVYSINTADAHTSAGSS